jgi:asparagine synthase (glutamine-hydrolysing)
MCGIAGIVERAATANAATLLASMLASQAHRGPEGTRMARHRGATFGHSRLAFVDLDAPRQPYRSNDDRLLISFNGEIYNHRVLREKAQASGLQIETPGEAALLAALCDAWPADG